MDLLSEAYHKSVAENERNLQIWENCLQNLKSLDISVYSEKLRVPILVPIGSRISFRGELQHTNEVTIALGADYFAKCSIKQAEEIRQHRIRDAQSKVDMYTKEKEYLENQISFKKTYYDQGQEIVEYQTEEDDKAWRIKHRENVRKYKQNKGKEEEKQAEDITDEELWNRLEELELQEELENELTGDSEEPFNRDPVKEIKEKPFVVKEEDYIKIKEIEKSDPDKPEVKLNQVSFQEAPPNQESKPSLLQQVLNKQMELEEKLIELKNRDGVNSKTEQELMARLDELEQIDELEDEMERLEDIIENEDIEDSDENTDVTKQTKLQRRVSFVDEDDSETLELEFKHSSVEPEKMPYDPAKGIQSPSDVYEAYSNLFGNGTTSILKKSKYEGETDVPKQKPSKGVKFVAPDNEILDNRAYEPQTIVVKDVVEKVNEAGVMPESQARPTSLFKKKRMQNKLR